VPAWAVWRRRPEINAHFFGESLMKTLLCCGLVAILVLAGGGAEGGDAEAVKKDLKALAGKWKVESFEDGQGKKQEFEGATLAFKEDNLEFTKDNETKKGKIKINPAGKPKEIDVMPEGKDDAMLGVYQIDGETLKICLTHEPGGARPNELAAKERWVLVVLKRVKE
jgi:uncharacterized protein (TIGR03067 family)